jgi:transcriptional regulator with XRE-family HTH domain
VTPAEYRALRLALKLNQTELARVLGVPREAVNRRENGRQPIPAEAAIAIRALAAARGPTAQADS